MGSGDTTAFRMALLAMEQYGTLMTALRPDLVPARSLVAVTDALRSADVPVWLPGGIAPHDGELGRAPAASSDALAVWLAKIIRADRVLLVKGRELCLREVGCTDAARLRIVDPCFCEYMLRAAVDVWVCGADAYTEFRAALYEEADCGTRLVHSGAGAIALDDALEL